MLTEFSNVLCILMILLPARPSQLNAMCNLYSITTNQEAIIRLFRVVNRYVGNLASMTGGSFFHWDEDKLVDCCYAHVLG